jgi:uncharacterized protein (TIGR02448 family)
MPRNLHKLAVFSLVLVSVFWTQQNFADGAAAAMMLPGMITSAPTGASFIGSLGSSDYTGETSSGHSHMKVAVRDDAALYVATGGSESRPALEMAFEKYRVAYPRGQMPKIEIATAILTDDAIAESLY